MEIPKFLLLLSLLSPLLSEPILLKFPGPNLFVTLDTSPIPPVFLAVSDAWIRQLPGYCAVTNRRFIDDGLYEFYFCGTKMCFDESTHALSACVKDELNTKWTVTPIDEASFVLSVDDFCLTIRGTDVVMERCKPAGTDQILEWEVHVAPANPAMADGGKATKEFVERVRLNMDEDWHRNESKNLKMFE